MVWMGNCSICAVGQDQMQPIMGKKYQSRKTWLKRCWSKKSPMDCCSAVGEWLCANAVHKRLKRSTSDNIPQKAGRAKLRRCANTVLSVEPFHSRLACGTFTENDMSEPTVFTFNSLKRRIRFG